MLSYYSLASGFLTGKYRSEKDLSKSPRGQRVTRYLNERGYRILNALDEVSTELNTSPAVVALAWAMSRPGITAPIASATSVEQLNELLNAVSLKMEPSQMVRLEKAGN